MWLGNASTSTGLQFRGAVIARAVMHAISAKVSGAEAVMIAGGSGVMATVDELFQLLPNVTSRAICDGCLVMPGAPLISTTDRSCGLDALSCPPGEVLRRGSIAWGSTISPAALLAPTLLSTVKTPMLVQHPQYDETQLHMNRADPKGSTGWLPATKRYIAAFGKAVRQVLLNRDGGLYAFSAACGPRNTSTLLAYDSFACLPVACQVSEAGGTAANVSDSMMSVVGMFLRDPMFRPVCVDQCGVGLCNPHCSVPQCF